MHTLVFPSADALRVALLAGLVPPDVQARPVRGGPGPDGTLHVSARGVPPAVQEALLGSGAVRGPPGELPAATCWAELLPPSRAAERPDDGAGGGVLFALPDGAALLPLAGELLRLGCDRQEWLALPAPPPGGPGALLRAGAPPYFTLLQALEPGSPVRAFVPAVAGAAGREGRAGGEARGGVWVELGFRHPLAHTLQPPAGHQLLVPGRGPWRLLPDGPWTALQERLDVQLPAPLAPLAPAPLTARLPVRLALRPAQHRGGAALWLVREEALAQMEALVASLPEDVAAGLLFAVTGPADAPGVVLRARGGAAPPAELPGQPFVPAPGVPTLFLPAGTLLEPPLRRETLRRHLAPDPDRITWLWPTADAGFRPESLPASAFSPLPEWVDYLVDQDAALLEGWVRSATFDFGAHASLGEPGPVHRPAPAPEAPEEPERGGPRRRRQRTPLAAPAAPAAAEPVERVLRLRASTAGPREPGALERALAEREGAYLALAAPAGAPERRALWAELGQLNGALGRHGDATLCWAQALWDAPDAEVAPLCEAWAASLEGAGAQGEAWAASLVCTLLLASARGHAVPGERLTQAQRLLDAGAGALDVRTLWLGKRALARLSGGDALGLARARDHILERLAHGLSRVRDVPAFQRVAHAGETAARREELERLLGRFASTRRQRSSVEAPLPHTLAYVSLVFAFGQARLGDAPRARALLAEARAALPAEDAVHQALAEAYAARIAQAVEGLPPTAPLPPDVAARLAGLDGLARYKADRLRQASAVLEPLARLDPVGAFARGLKDARGEEFAALPVHGESGPLVRALGALVQRALAASGEERARLTGGLLEHLPLLPEAHALPHLDALVAGLGALPLPQRLPLLSGALRAAGHFGRTDRVRALAEGALLPTLASLPPDSLEPGVQAACAAVGILRSADLPRDAERLLAAAASRLPPDAPAALRLTLAAGQVALGALEEATPALDAAFEALSREALPMPERLATTRRLAVALSRAPGAVALPGLSRLAAQLPLVTDRYNTNSHFCLSVVELADALVLAHASDALALGPEGRRLLEEEEARVRRRIHQDLQESR
jgi:hypothetical protein